MSDPTRAPMTCWPCLQTLREDFAEQAKRAAEVRQAETGWTTEETVERVRAAAVDAVEEISEAVLAAALMALDVWAVSR